jgi:hypothetical protein
MSHQFWIALELTASYAVCDKRFMRERRLAYFIDGDDEKQWRKSFWAGWVRDRLLVVERGGLFPPRGGGAGDAT